MIEVRPFLIEVPEADLDDLRERLARTRSQPKATILDVVTSFSISYISS